jgi:hypothetical protein
LIVGDDADALLDRLVVWRPDGVDKWLDRSDR